MSPFYTFFSSLYNFLLKSISLIILSGEVRKSLGEVLKFSGEVQRSSQRRCAPPRTYLITKMPVDLAIKVATNRLWWFFVAKDIFA